jgi:PiT family inorganic phosphate transporter
VGSAQGRGNCVPPQAACGAIIGVGAARRVSAVRWGIAGNIVVAWTVTLPATAAISALTYFAVSLAT